MRLLYLKGYRKGPATNSSSTHSLIFKNKNDMFKDMNIFEENYYGRRTETIAVSKSAKIKYIAANIMYNKPLYDIMCLIYPEMDQYRELIKKAITGKEKYDDEAFGMYSRGRMYFNPDNLEASIMFLKNIIDNDDIIIVGGSDEEEFIYDTIENHKKIELPDYLWKIFGSVKNGNYWVGYKHGRKIRFSTYKDICIPEYPELIDLKITDMCEHNCPFCYMDSNSSGKHADLQNIKDLIKPIKYDHVSDFSKNRKIEFAIGGGNILLYPDLEELFKFLTDEGHIVNTTINAKDYHLLFDCEENTNKKIKSIFDKYVTAVGVSVSSKEDAEILIKYGCWRPERYKNIITQAPDSTVIHMIPELLGVDKTNEIIKILQDDKLDYNYYFYSILFLGYKTNGRGITQQYTTFNDIDLDKLLSKKYCISVDTTFANRYIDWLKDHFETSKTLTLLEGEYSMYVDAVNLKAYKSSYMLQQPYNLATRYMVNTDNLDGNKPTETIISAFTWIRRDNNLPIYNEW